MVKEYLRHATTSGCILNCKVVQVEVICWFRFTRVGGAQHSDLARGIRMGKAVCNDGELLINSDERSLQTVDCFGSHHGFRLGSKLVIDLALDAEDRPPIGIDDVATMERSHRVNDRERLLKFLVVGYDCGRIFYSFQAIGK